MDEISFTSRYMEFGLGSKMKFEKFHRIDGISFTYTYMEFGL